MIFYHCGKHTYDNPSKLKGLNEMHEFIEKARKNMEESQTEISDDQENKNLSENETTSVSSELLIKKVKTHLKE